MSKLYRVDVFESVYHYVFVRTDSREEAIGIAHEHVMSGETHEAIEGYGMESLGTTGVIETHVMEE